MPLRLKKMLCIFSPLQGTTINAVQIKILNERLLQAIEWQVALAPSLQPLMFIYSFLFILKSCI